MNRKKKINDTLKAKAKKANAKLAGNNKPRYVSKAERLAGEQRLMPPEGAIGEVPGASLEE
jgi:hypothetical protein